MKFCHECGTELPDDAAFCHKCGTKMPNMGDLTSSDAAELVTATESAAETVENDRPSLPDEKGADAKKRKLIFGGIALAVVAVIVATTAIIISNKKLIYGFYIKNDQLYYTDLKGDPIKLTKKLYSFDGESQETIKTSDITITQDGKTVFYPDRMNESGYTLCYRRLSGFDKDGKNIDGEVCSYAVSDNAKMVTYLCDLMVGSDENKYGTLCQFDLKTKTEIADEVTYYAVSADGKRIVYTDNEGALCRFADKKTVKLAEGVANVTHVTEDLSTVYYFDANSVFYKADVKGKIIKIADNVLTAAVFDSGEIYYAVGENMKLINFIRDRHAESDARMGDLEQPEYPSRADYSSAYDYERAVDEYRTAYNRYMVKRDQYAGKQSRDQMRERVSNYVTDIIGQRVYYYDGSKSKAITDQVLCTDAVKFVSVEGNPMVTFGAASLDNIKKTELSTIKTDYSNDGGNRLYSVETEKIEQVESNTDYYIAVGDKLRMLSGVSELVIDSNGETAYYTTPYSQGGHELYSLDVTNSKAKPQLIDDTVNFFEFCGNTPMYFKHHNSNQPIATLYINGSVVDKDVCWQHSVECMENGEIVVYISDCDIDENEGTLKVFKGGREIKIQDDTASFNAFAGGKVVYLAKRSKRAANSDLYYFNGRRSKEIESNVALLLDVQPANRQGMYCDRAE